MNAAWNMQPASADLSERSVGTVIFFKGLTVTIAGWTPGTGGEWALADLNGTHVLTQDLSLLEDPQFNGQNFFPGTAAGPGMFCGKQDLGTTNRTVEGVTTHWATTLYAALFALLCAPEAMTIGLRGMPLTGATVMPCGLLLWIVGVAEDDTVEKFVELGWDTNATAFGLRTGRAFVLPMNNPAYGSGATFALKLTK